MDKLFLSQHISQRFNEDLEDILNRVMAMGGLVEQQLADALTALVDGDQELAQKVIATESQVNDMEVALDVECTNILARRQPAASDLRLVIAVLKAITDLERIGDESERIARMAQGQGGAESYQDVLVEMDTLGRHVRLMLRSALDAFARMDANHAVLVAHEDIHADRQYEAIMRKLVDKMMADPASVPHLMDVIWAARALERIGDRSRNVCEYVVYFVKGKDVRHTSLEQMAERAGYAPEKPQDAS